jgi:hypothetical protein
MFLRLEKKPGTNVRKGCERRPRHRVPSVRFSSVAPQRHINAPRPSPACRRSSLLLVPAQVLAAPVPAMLADRILCHEGELKSGSPRQTQQFPTATAAGMRPGIRAKRPQQICYAIEAKEDPFDGTREKFRGVAPTPTPGLAGREAGAPADGLGRRSARPRRLDPRADRPLCELPFGTVTMLGSRRKRPRLVIRVSWFVPLLTYAGKKAAVCGKYTDVSGVFDEWLGFGVARGLSVLASFVRIRMVQSHCRPDLAAHINQTVPSRSRNATAGYAPFEAALNRARNHSPGC